MIPYLKTSDGTLIIQLPSGPTIVNKKSFNYKRIGELLPTGTLNDLATLLVPPSCPNGVFYLYLLDDTLLYNHVHEDQNYTKKLIGQRHSHEIFLEENFAGTYTSLDDIREDYPEFFL